MAVVGKAVSTGSSILWKIILYGTGIIVLIVGLQSAILSSQEKSLRPIIQGIGQRILASDSYLYEQMEKIKQNPEKIYYEAKYIKAEKDFASDATRLQLEYEKLNSRYEKFKFYLSKIWTYADLIFTILFLITIFFLLYKGVNAIGNFSPLGNAVIALIIFSFLQVTFTLMLYDHNLYDNKDFSELSISKQSYLLTPIKGVIELGKNFNYLIGVAYEKVAIPIENAKTSDDLSTQIIAKTLG